CGLTVARNPFNGAELWFLVGIQADVSALDEISLHKAEQEVHRVANDIRSRLADQLSALAISGALMSNFEVSDEGNYLRSREYSKPRDLDPEVWSLLPTPQWKSGAIPSTPPAPVSDTALSGNARALLVRGKQECQEEVCTARCWPMVYMGITAAAIALGLAVVVQHKNMRPR
ncbi:pfyP, partial [Symbiodinium microadriaticum]